LVARALGAEHSQPHEVTLHLIRRVGQIAERVGDLSINILDLGPRPTGRDKLLADRRRTFQELSLLLPELKPRLEVGAQLLLPGQIRAEIKKPRFDLLALLVPRLELGEDVFRAALPVAQRLDPLVRFSDRAVCALPERASNGCSTVRESGAP
jgi:hypothetical protein